MRELCMQGCIMRELCTGADRTSHWRTCDLAVPTVAAHRHTEDTLLLCCRHTILSHSVPCALAQYIPAAWGAHVGACATPHTAVSTRIFG